MEDKYFAALGAAFASVAFTIYLFFYDILIPGIPDGSYRLAVGAWFAVPSFILAYGQALIAGIILYFASHTLKGKPNFAKSFFIASVLVFIFSLTYAIFPMYGPFYYIVFATGAAPANVLLVEVAWTALAVAASTLMVERMHVVKRKYALLTTLVVLIFITVAAS